MPLREHFSGTATRIPSLSHPQVVRACSIALEVVPMRRLATFNPSAILVVSASWVAVRSATAVSTCVGATIAAWVGNWVFWIWIFGTSAADLVVFLEPESPSELTSCCQLPITRDHPALDIIPQISKNNPVLKTVGCNRLAV